MLRTDRPISLVSVTPIQLPPANSKQAINAEDTSTPSLPNLTGNLFDDANEDTIMDNNDELIASLLSPRSPRQLSVSVIIDPCQQIKDITQDKASNEEEVIIKDDQDKVEPPVKLIFNDPVLMDDGIPMVDLTCSTIEAEFEDIGDSSDSSDDTSDSDDIISIPPSPIMDYELTLSPNVTLTKVEETDLVNSISGTDTPDMDKKDFPLQAPTSPQASTSTATLLTSQEMKADPAPPENIFAITVEENRRYAESIAKKLTDSLSFN